MSEKTNNTTNIVFSEPSSKQGISVHALIKSCPPLDENSLYCNLLQCSHFADTCVVATIGEDVVAFLSAYFLPSRPDTLFVWQVAVSERCRGLGVALKMLNSLLKRPICSATRYIETTITPDNIPSQKLFQKLSLHLQARTHVTTIFDRDVHFGGAHESEELWRIGPISLPHKSN